MSGPLPIKEAHAPDPLPFMHRHPLGTTIAVLAAATAGAACLARLRRRPRDYTRTDAFRQLTGDWLM